MRFQYNVQSPPAPLSKVSITFFSLGCPPLHPRRRRYHLNYGCLILKNKVKLLGSKKHGLDTNML